MTMGGEGMRGEPVQVRRALLSVSDKTGLLDLARALDRQDRKSVM